MTRRILALVLFSALAGLTAQAENPNGRAGTMPAYYDEELFTINFKEEPDTAAAALLAHNKSINVIYVFEDALPDGSMFVAVIAPFKAMASIRYGWKGRSNSHRATHLINSSRMKRLTTQSRAAKSRSTRKAKSIAVRSSVRSSSY